MEEKQLPVEKKAWGGKRPGAGKPKGTRHPRTVLAEKAKEELVRHITRKWKQILDTKLRLALGEYYIEAAKDGQKRYVYKATPHSQSLSELIEFVVGKPKQSIESEVNGRLETPGMAELAESIKAVLESKTINHNHE